MAANINVVAPSNRQRLRTSSFFIPVLPFFILVIITVLSITQMAISSSQSSWFLTEHYWDSPPASTIPPPVPAVPVDLVYLREHDRIDYGVSAEERCARFGVGPNPEGTPPRRLFFGSLVADESWQLLAIHSVEAYNVYHAIALVESNTTQTNTPRATRFSPGSDLERALRFGHMFGNQTNVMLRDWTQDRPDILNLVREFEQMNAVVEMWGEAGMTEEDVGVVADMDEIVSRDFLRALQVCDFPQFRPGQTCQEPKLCLATMTFESSPRCAKKTAWYHPDVISGQCVAGIGDPTERIVPLREHNRRYGERSKEYGRADANSFPKHVLDSGRFPLYQARDIRMVVGCADGLTNYNDTPGHGETALFGAAYHLHNWFDDLHVLRNKYATYGHAVPGATSIHLTQLHPDIDLMVQCARNLGDKIKTDYLFADEKLGGNRPIFFLDETYVNERHSMLRRMVAEDEAKFGSDYTDDGNMTTKEA